MAPAALEICPVELPGRGARLCEEPFRTIVPMVTAIESGLRPLMDRPFGLFGNSMGALIAFELARRLVRSGGPRPAFVSVAANAAPHIPLRGRPMHDLPEEEFLRELRAMGGTPVEVFADRELLAIVLPALRADLAVCETYQHEIGPPLSCSILAFGGESDPFIPPHQIEAWSLHTVSSFACTMLPGGHFFLMHNMAAVLRLIVEHVRVPGSD